MKLELPLFRPCHTSHKSSCNLQNKFLSKVCISCMPVCFISFINGMLCRSLILVYFSQAEGGPRNPAECHLLHLAILIFARLPVHLHTLNALNSISHFAYLPSVYYSCVFAKRNYMYMVLVRVFVCVHMCACSILDIAGSR